MNKVNATGRLTRDAEVRYSQGDKPTAIARANLAVDRRFRREQDEQTADFIPLVAFGREAEFLEKYGRKGIKFEISGRLQSGSYVNKDGIRVYTLDLVVEEIGFAERKQDGGAGAAAAGNSDDYENMSVPDDEELPFN